MANTTTKINVGLRGTVSEWFVLRNRILADPEACCLSTGRTFDVVRKWLNAFGREQTLQLLNLIKDTRPTRDAAKATAAAANADAAQQAKNLLPGAKGPLPNLPAPPVDDFLKQAGK